MKYDVSGRQRIFPTNTKAKTLLQVSGRSRGFLVRKKDQIQTPATDNLSASRASSFRGLISRFASSKMQTEGKGCEK